MKKMSNYTLAVFLLLSGPIVKAQITPSAKLLTINTISSDAGAIKATRDFWKKMGDGKDEKWYRLPKGYLAFYQDSVSEGRVVYDQQGRWLYTLLTFDEIHVPETITAALQGSYSGYYIRWAKEITEGESTLYVAHLEGPHQWKEVVIQDGEVRETKAYARK